MVRITIEKNPNMPDAWHQGILIINEQKHLLGRSFFDKRDCLQEMEQIVVNFAREGVNVEHGGIY